RHDMPGLWTVTPKREGAGNAGCLGRTRSLACEMEKHTSVVTTGQPKRSGIPRAMVLTVYPRTLPGVPGLIASVALQARAARLDASVGAPGPHAFAVHGQSLALRPAASIASLTQRSVAIGRNAPPAGQDGRDHTADLGFWKREIFLAGGLDMDSENQHDG